MSARLTPINYADYIPEKIELPPYAQINRLAPVDGGWGQLETTAMALPQFSVIVFNSKLDRDIHLKKKFDSESTTVETCVFLNGRLESKFNGLDTRISMQGGMQNFIYQPQADVDHYIPAQENLSIVHMLVDKTYYTTLLSDEEKWSAELKASILDRKVVCGLTHNTKVTVSVSRVVTDILNCQLTGSLRSMVLEARILEFLGLQLDSLVKEKEIIVKGSMKSDDRDKLFALRDYLKQSFGQDHSLKSLSREFAVNEFKLKKGFKLLFGSTVFDYIHDLRMDHARNLLMSGEKYVNEVSGMVGYKNANHFSTAFKKRYGVNPTLFKN